MRLLLLLILSLLALAGCGSDVSVCLDFDEDPPSCELCANGQDDDGDGRVDCQDGDCRDTAGCARAAAASTSTTLPEDGPGDPRA